MREAANEKERRWELWSCGGRNERTMQILLVNTSKEVNHVRAEFKWTSYFVVWSPLPGPATFISTTTKEAGLACFSTTMATHKVKISASLQPRLKSDIDNDSVKIVHRSNDSGGSSSPTSGGSFIMVANPRDPTQIFKFPCVHTKIILPLHRWHVLLGFQVVMTKTQRRRRYSRMTSNH